MHEAYRRRTEPVPSAGQVPNNDEQPGMAAVANCLKPELHRFQSILVPVDFSRGCAPALRLAVSLAEQFHAKITLLHVLAPMYAGRRIDRREIALLKAELRSEAEEKLANLIRRHVSPYLCADYFVRQGKPYDVITATARQRNVELIVLSTHGHSQVQSALEKQAQEFFQASRLRHENDLARHHGQIASVLHLMPQGHHGSTVTFGNEGLELGIADLNQRELRRHKEAIEQHQ